MKNIFFSLLFTAIALLVIPAELSSSNFSHSSILLSGGDPHDTLLFDGSDAYLSPADKCPITVTYITGIGEATVIHTRMVLICGDKVDTETTYKKGEVKINDELKAGDEITTGPGAYMQIDFPDGSQIRMGPNSKVIVNKDWCVDYGLSEFAGDVWHKMKRLLGSGKYEVKSEIAALGQRGTIYTVSTRHEGGDTITTVKVYEGSVEVMLTKIDNSALSNGAVEMQKAVKDLGEGKITQDEYMKKMKELSENTMGDASRKTKATVTAGNMCIITKSLNEPVPINSDDEKWFETNFPK